jgi:hypothetical protein
VIDTISGAKASAIWYSLAETAKANNLKPYEYFKYLLEEIPKHLQNVCAITYILALRLSTKRACKKHIELHGISLAYFP